MPSVSVIVPVYKAEICLTRCVNSILCQSFSDFELILVDDASPDTSGILCDKLAETDSRIRVIHKEKNAGASAARNTGLDAACGQYIAFCDSDDCVSPHWLEHLAMRASEDTLPMCDYCADIGNLGMPSGKMLSAGQLYSATAYFRFQQTGIAGFLWNALYSGKVIQAHQLRLRTQHEKGDYNEDLLFALQYARYMKHIVYTGFSDYLYDAHSGSLSRSYDALYFEKYEEKYRLWQQFLEEAGQPEQIQALATSMLYHFLTALNYEKYQGFCRIVHSETVQHCLAHADTSAENPRIINLIRKKAVFPLWLIHQLHVRKGKKA